MGAPSTDKVRNIALVGQDGAGKTSLAEALLFVTGKTQRMGTTADGKSNLDFDPEEVKRQFTISTSIAPVSYKDCKINVLDAPGSADFLGDTIAAMEASEMALFVVDAVSGAGVMTKKIWEIAEESGICRSIFVNHIDKENANFDEALANLQGVFGTRVGAVNIPIGTEKDFKGVVDIVRMKAICGSDVSDIPAEYADAAEAARDALCELVAEADDDLMMKYLEGEPFEQEELESLIGKAIAQDIFIPVFVGCATAAQGATALLDDIVAYFPDPTAHKPIELASGDTCEINPDGDPAGLVFKTLSDPYVGRLSFVKVISGTFEPGTDFLNSRTKQKERPGHLYVMCGKENEDIKAAPAGDIVVIPKLSGCKTGDTLSKDGSVEVAPMPLPKPLYPVALEAKDKKDEDKLGDFLAKSIEADPTLYLRRDEETHQTLLYGLGDTQIDVTLAHMKERAGIEVNLLDIRVPYRETIRKVAEAQGRHKKQTGGAGQFGDCWLRLEPNPGGGYEFLDEVVGGHIPRGFIPAVDKGVQETMSEGVLAGYPVVDIKCAVYDGSYHPVDSNEMAFKTAAHIGFKAACAKADMYLLEPMADMVITVDEEYAGAIMGDLPTRRGRIAGMDTNEKGNTVIRARVPYAEVVQYGKQLRSMTRGSGSYTIEVNGYEEVPRDTAQKIIEEFEASKNEK